MSANFEFAIRVRGGSQRFYFKEIAADWKFPASLILGDIKIRCRQALLGGLWAILPPFIVMLLYSHVCNRLANVQSDGSPYQFFAYPGLAPWTFFSTFSSVRPSSNGAAGLWL